VIARDDGAAGKEAGGTRHRHPVPPEAAGERLDRFLAALHPDRSRSRIQALVREGLATVDGRPARPGERLRGGELVEIVLPPEPPEDRIEPEPLPLEVLHEDEHLAVLVKPAGVVVHPGAGVREGTLAAAILHRWPETAGVGGPGRPGIVHRLDRGTSGVILVARTAEAHRALQEQFRERTVEKRYAGICWGRPREPSGRIELPVGRDPRSRVKMTTRARGGRPAITLWRVLEEVPGFALVEARILTGRTHQVRVHLAAIGHPLAGDDVYGGRRERSVADPVRRGALRALERPALHALEIAFDHPATGRRMRFRAPWPPDLRDLWTVLGGRLVPGGPAEGQP